MFITSALGTVFKKKKKKKDQSTLGEKSLFVTFKKSHLRQTLKNMFNSQKNILKKT